MILWGQPFPAVRPGHTPAAVHTGTFPITANGTVASSRGGTSLSCCSRPAKPKLMRLQVHPPPAKPHALCLQPQALFHRRVPLQFNRATGPQHPLPRQSKPTAQNPRHLARGSRKPRRARDRAVRRHFPARNRTNRALDPQTHRARIFLLGFSRHRTPALPSHGALPRGPNSGAPLCGVPISAKLGILTLIQTHTLPV